MAHCGDTRRRVQLIGTGTTAHTIAGAAPPSPARKAVFPARHRCDPHVGVACHPVQVRIVAVNEFTFMEGPPTFPNGTAAVLNPSARVGVAWKVRTPATPPPSLALHCRRVDTLAQYGRMIACGHVGPRRAPQAKLGTTARRRTVGTAPPPSSRCLAAHPCCRWRSVGCR